jgi:16S rRNA (guanine527-N7)-methyltransferase
VNETSAEFAAAAAELGVPLHGDQVAAFEAYAALLLEWNERFNLLGPAAVAALWSRHFLDALTIVRGVPNHANDTPTTVLDVGSGAGIPGIPLQIAFPHWEVTLLEVTNKKVHFLELATRELGLSRTQVVQGRAEDVAHDTVHREAYDLGVARAVTHTSALVELTLPFVAVGGSAILYKGMTGLSEELQDAEPARVILGAAPPSVIPISMGGGDSRSLVRYLKTSRTPSTLPRRAGLPEQHALTAADGTRIAAATAAARERRRKLRARPRRHQ